LRKWSELLTPFSRIDAPLEQKRIETGGIQPIALHTCISETSELLTPFSRMDAPLEQKRIETPIHLAYRGALKDIVGIVDSIFQNGCPVRVKRGLKLLVISAALYENFPVSELLTPFKRGLREFMFYVSLDCVKNPYFKGFFGLG